MLKGEDTRPPGLPGQRKRDFLPRAFTTRQQGAYPERMTTSQDISQAQESPSSHDGDLLFDAELTPHRSLSPRGFVILMTAVCVVSFGAGLAFFLVGAWPVIGFMGADVLLIYAAFKINYRHGRMSETLQLSRSRLTVKRYSHWGEVKTWEFQPYWLQVLIDDPVGPDSQLVLRSHGLALTIGAFLAPHERAELAVALKQALTDARSHPQTS